MKDGKSSPPTNETQWELGLRDNTSNNLSAQLNISVAWERALWEKSFTIRDDLKREILYLRLLVSYFFILRTSVVHKESIRWTEPVSTSTMNIENRVLWRTTAEMINSIILGLSSASQWGSKAYLVIQALAGK